MKSASSSTGPGAWGGPDLRLPKKRRSRPSGVLEAGSGVAVVSFSSGAGTNFPFSVVTNTTRMQAQNAAASLFAGGSTAIGRGLLVGDSELQKGQEGASKSIVLLSDGDENVAPFVADVLPQLSASVSAGKSSSGLAQLRDALAAAEEYNGPIIHTVALGAGVDQRLMNAIADITGGVYVFAASEMDLPQVFVEILSRIRSEQVLLTLEGVLAPESSIEQALNIDGSVAEVTITLTSESDLVGLALEGPDGEYFDPNYLLGQVKYLKGDGYASYTLYNPSSGEWTATLDNFDTSPSSYTTLVSGESLLELDVFFNRDEYPIGSPIVVSARLTESEEPVTGASVTADVMTPTSAFGKIVASFEAQTQSPSKREAVERPQLSIQRSAGRLSYRSEEGTVLFTRAATLELFDDGEHRDGAAGDGVYANTFEETDVQGTYSFTVMATGTAPVSGAFTREASADALVTAGAVVDDTPPVCGPITPEKDGGREDRCRQHLRRRSGERHPERSVHAVEECHRLPQRKRRLPGGRRRELHPNLYLHGRHPR